MVKPPLSMKPTGRFQVAWSPEIAVGDVHRMTYFGRDLIAWRSAAGAVTVMDAYCAHLGRHNGAMDGRPFFLDPWGRADPVINAFWWAPEPGAMGLKPESVRR